MMARISGRALLSLVLLATSAIAAQTRPDFSGKWVDVQSVGGKEVIEETLVVTQDAQGLSYVSYASNGREGERLAVLFNGAPKSQPRQMEGEATSTAKWEANTLVVATTVKRPGRPEFSHERRFSIDTAKQLVIETTTKAEGAAPRSAKTVYRRQHSESEVFEEPLLSRPWINRAAAAGRDGCRTSPDRGSERREAVTPTP
jgi:hypothetical protein